MQLLGDKDYAHGAVEQIGVLLVNLGTPTAPTAAALRRYLRQFLSDTRVIESPRWRWLPILYGIVLPFRAPRSAAAYKKIWTAAGSPLMQNCMAQQQQIAAAFADESVAVELGMSYGTPSIAAALHKLKSQNCRRIVVLPLYPQYASSTTGSVFVDVVGELSRWRAVPHLRFVAAYADDARYIGALADSIDSYWQQHGRADELIFSFHGTPKEMLLAGDPYHCLCHKTARLTATKLNLRADEWRTVFQSRFGRSEWLRPYADETIKSLPKQGVRRVHVVCPGFSADCLETLEEIAGENREYFMEAGGEEFGYIPALNDSARHIKFLQDLIKDNIADWLMQLQKQNTPAERERQKTAAKTKAGK